jgi:fatty-acyl-CoA synthase
MTDLAIWEPGGPIRGQTEIAALEEIPLESRITEWDINAWLRRGLAADPDKVAITYFQQADPEATPTVLHYRELRARANRIANLLHRLGVRSGDAVQFLLPVVPDLFAVLVASMARGIASPVNWMLEPAHLLDLIRAADASVVIVLGTTPDFAIWEKISAIRDQISPNVRIFSLHAPGGTLLPDSDLLTAAANESDELVFSDRRGRDDVVAYIHSGGTTGAPKLVKLTSGGFVHKVWTITVTMAHRPTDILFADMPMFHIAGFVHCGVQPLVHGASLVVPSPLGARDRLLVRNYWKFVERFRISFLHAVPTTLGLLAQNPPQSEDISSLAPYSVTGSTALPVATAEAIERGLGIRLVATYGATEFTMNVSQAPRDGEPRYGSAGIRNPYTQIRVVRMDAAGNILGDCAPDEIGAVLLRSPGTTPGYVGIAPDPKILLGDGWINNGDLGRLDAQGYLWITGRAKDVIIRGGHNIDPGIIEDALRRHPAVLMAAAVAKPDLHAGELPTAYVQLKDNAAASEEELRDFARQHVTERAAAPQEVVILAELPLTDVRKVNRNALREDAACRVFSAVLAGVLPAGVTATVTVGADPQHGTLANVILSGDPGQRATAEAAARAALRGFTLAHALGWHG